MTEIQKNTFQQNCDQVNAIFSLEGFQVTDEVKIVNDAVMRGLVTYDQVIKEKLAYFKSKGSSDGFIQQASWVVR